MAESELKANREANLLNGKSPLEAQLARLFAEQRRLRELLENTRAELDRVNAKVLQAQEEFCTTPERENEYCECVKNLLGFDPRIDLQEIEEARKDPQSFQELLAELERIQPK